MTARKTSTPSSGKTAWDPAAAFRASFLESLPPAARSALLRQLCPRLRKLAGAADRPPVAGEPPVREALRATVADLRHLEGFLDRVIRLTGDGLHPDEDLRIVVIVSRFAGTLRRIVGTLEKALSWRTVAVRSRRPTRGKP